MGKTAAIFGLVPVVFVVSCSSTSTFGGPATPTASAPRVLKHVEHGSGKLAIRITPKRGPVGTIVAIRGTNCLDADGLNHAVSFNPDTADERPNARVDPIQASLAGESLSARYTITAEDAAGSGQGRFFVQCATDLRDAPFTISTPSLKAFAGRAIILGSHGLGPVEFGTGKKPATAELTELLGPPSAHGPNTGCGPTFTEVHWGELAVEFHNNTFTGYRDINRPTGGLQLTPKYTSDYPIRPAAKTSAGIRLGESLAQVRAAYSKLSLAGANRHRASNGISFVDNSLQSPAPPQARIIEIRIGTCGSY